MPNYTSTLTDVDGNAVVFMTNTDHPNLVRIQPLTWDLNERGDFETDTATERTAAIGYVVDHLYISREAVSAHLYEHLFLQASNDNRELASGLRSQERANTRLHDAIDGYHDELRSLRDDLSNALGASEMHIDLRNCVCGHSSDMHVDSPHIGCTTTSCGCRKFTPVTQPRSVTLGEM